MIHTAQFRRTIANMVRPSGRRAANLVNSGAARAVTAAAIVLAWTSVAGSPALAAANTNVKTCDESHLDAAVVGAPSGGTVSFNCDGTITLTHPIYVAKSLTLDGSGHAVTLSGGNAVQLLQVASSGNLAVNRLTLTGGNTAYNGGAIASQGSLTVSNSIFTNNSAGVEGGAIFASGTLTVSNVLFNGNTSSMWGGALSVEGYSSGQATVTNAIFTNNSASSFGGAIFNGGGMTINNSTIGVRGAGNSSGYMGGGIENDASMSINGSMIKYNTALLGGGIMHNNGPSISLSGDTVEYNTATELNGGGGGIYIIGDTTVVTSVNTTWAYNTPDNCNSGNNVSVPGCTG